ncbi:MAG: hypothetical protein AAB267_08390, partial [Candidatus Desantisbacteria bacterium]
MVENYEFAITGPVSIQYIYIDKRNTESGERMVRVTENIISIGNANIMESVQFSYMKKSDDGKWETWTETRMGDFNTNDTFVTQIQREYWDTKDGKTVKVSKIYEAGLNTPVSTQYYYKEIGERDGKKVILTVIETYEAGITQPISVQKIWKNIENGRVVTHIENYEVDLTRPISIQLTWRVLENSRIVTYTETYMGDLANLNTDKAIMTELQKSYRESKDVLVIETYEPLGGLKDPINTQKIHYEVIRTPAGKLRLARIIENYEYGLANLPTVQRIYFDIRKTETGGDSPRLAQVVENMISLGGSIFTLSVQYIFRKMDDVYVLENGQQVVRQRLVAVIETYEGLFT